MKFLKMNNYCFKKRGIIKKINNNKLSNSKKTLSMSYQKQNKSNSMPNYSTKLNSQTH